MNLRKIVVALAALGASSMALAGTIDSTCASDNVTVGCEQAGWQVGANFLYVQPSGDQLYSDLSSNSKWASGFELNAAYLFGEGKDINLSWTYFSNTSKRNVRPVGNLFSDFITENPEQEVIGLSNSAEKIKNKFSAINLEFGQTAYWGSQVTTRLHAGLQYVSIKQDRSHFNQTATFYEPFFEETFFMTSGVKYKQTFKGIGPRVGADVAYAIGDSNFSLVGKSAIAALVGTSKVSKNTSSLAVYDDEGGFLVTYIFRNQSTRTVVPALEGKLGLQYNAPLATGTLTLEAGYQVVNYLQAMKAPINEAPLSSATQTGFPGDQNNFGYHGFYAGLKWQGDLI